MTINAMLQFGCDRCGRTQLVTGDIENPSYPADWLRISFSHTGKVEKDPMLCVSCAQMLRRWLSDNGRGQLGDSVANDGAF